LDYGLYWLKNASGENVTATEGATLDEIERYLTKPR
jgi:hypothetical protein